MRLLQIAERYWFEIDGQAALSGVDLMRLPFRRFVLAILAWADPRGIRNEEQSAEFDAWLYAPLAQLDPDKVSEEVIESEMAAFSAFASQAGGVK